MMKWTPFETGQGEVVSRQYIYIYDYIKYRNEDGIEAETRNITRRHLRNTSKYRPHQGPCECARRAAREFARRAT